VKPPAQEKRDPRFREEDGSEAAGRRSRNLSLSRTGWPHHFGQLIAELTVFRLYCAHEA
jgi:hypothetical protein